MWKCAVLCLAVMGGLPVVALGGTVFVDVSEGVWLTEFSGQGWFRTFPDEQGWFIVRGWGGDFVLNHLGDNLEVDWIDDEQIWLTGRNDLVDHAISRCPGGGYLHVSFSNATGEDVQRSFRYDDQWELLEEHVLVSDPSVRAADAPILCSSVFNLTAHGWAEQVWYRIVVMGEDGAPLSTEELAGDILSGGSSMLAEPETDTFFIVGVPWQQGSGLQLVQLDKTFDVVDSKELEIPVPSNRRAFWPQGLMKVGDHYLVAYVVTTEASGVYADTGDIWLSAFDARWDLVDTVPVVEEKSGEWWAYMRPGLSRKGNELLVSFDIIEGPFLAVVTLDLKALGEDDPDGFDWNGDDDSLSSEGSGDDDTPGDDDSNDDSGGCGCLLAVATRPGSTTTGAGAGGGAGGGSGAGLALWIAAVTLAGCRRRRGSLGVLDLPGPS